jgi:hypothetical protein
MNKKKSISLIAAASMILLTVTATFSGLQIFTVNVVYALDLRHSATVSPSSTILTTLPVTVTYSVNVTSLGADYLNETCIKLPTGWTNATNIAPPSHWDITTNGSDGWLNFTTTATDFKNGYTYNFSIPTSISMIPPTQATWSIYCYNGTNPSANNPVSVTVTVSLEFSSTMTPNYVRNSSYIYTITTTNNYVNVGIKQLNITFPTGGGWIFNVLVDYSPRTWSELYDNVSNTFQLTGPSILIGESVTIKVNMTVAYGAGTWKDPDYWNVTAWDSSNAMLGTYSISAVVDNYIPTITIDAPSQSQSYYTVSSGNYIWINATVTDYPSIAKYGITVSINDTRFGLQSSEKVNDNSYKYYFVNNTAIPDGTLAVKITAVDPAGNTGTTPGSTTVDNTPPKLCSIYVLDQAGSTLYQDSGGTFWMKNDTTAISVNASFYNPSGFTGYVYFNNTGYVFTNGTLVPSGNFSVAGSNLVILNITLTDGALPTPNCYTNTWNIRRDTAPPSAPSYTKIDAICGGAIIRGLTATDDVGIQQYNIYINGTLESITPAELSFTTMLPKGNLTSFSGTLVLNLSSYAGAVANITIQAVDYGSNLGTANTTYITVPAGTWYPIELQPKWNMISLPLIPNSTATADIYALILNQGSSGVTVTYAYDQTTDRWVYNPAQLTDGFGYWVYMKAYDVLIVQGTTSPIPPAPPTSYSYTTGWVLAGYKSLQARNMTDYLASLQSGSYFIYIYTWNATTQNWIMIDTRSSTQLKPSQAFWIYMYTNQSLIPPIP